MVNNISYFFIAVQELERQLDAFNININRERAERAADAKKKLDAENKVE